MYIYIYSTRHGSGCGGGGQAPQRAAELLHLRGGGGVVLSLRLGHGEKFRGQLRARLDFEVVQRREQPLTQRPPLAPRLGHRRLDPRRLRRSQGAGYVYMYMYIYLSIYLSI